MAPRSSPLRILLDRVEPSDHQVYMRAEDGPFRCDHCSHYHTGSDTCDEPHINEAARRGLYGLNWDGRHAVVDPGGCSDYFDPRKGGTRAEVS